MQIYSAQQKYRDKHKNWATSTKELDLPEPPTGFPEHTVNLKGVEKGYEASITFTPAGKPPRTLTVREDSKITDSR